MDSDGMKCEALMGVHIMSCLNQSAYTVVSITEQLGMGQASFSRTKESEVGRVHV